MFSRLPTNILRWRVGLTAWIVLCGCAVVALGRLANAADRLQFEDATAQSGIDFRHYSPLTVQRHVHLVMGSGLGWIDFDGDGWTDLYCGQGSNWPQTSRESSRLFRNRADGTFADVTEAAGLIDPFYSMGIAAGDYDNDGFPDLYVAAFGTSRCYHNNGDGTFTEVAALLKVEHTGYGASCTWGDIDADGLLDLFAVNYLTIDPKNYPLCSRKVGDQILYFACHPQRIAPQYDAVYRNLGDGTFEDATTTAGLKREPARQGLGVAAADLDDDGDLDFYVANDTLPNQLWENEGHGVFVESGLASLTALNRDGVAGAGMGIALGDTNNDGRFDLYVTNFYGETNTFYRNEGQLLFSDVTDEMGLAAPSRLRLGFGTTFLDVDNDGWLDLFVANGHIHDRPQLFGRHEPFEQLAQLFKNQRGIRFTEVSKTAGPYFAREVVGRGCAQADYDRDGRVDLSVQHLNSSMVLLRNMTEPAGQSLRLTLVGKESNRSGIGAVLRVQTGNLRLTRLRNGSTSYLSCDEARVIVGIGVNKSAQRLVIAWPSGRREFWSNLSAGIDHCLIEGSGTAE